MKVLSASGFLALLILFISFGYNDGERTFIGSTFLSLLFTVPGLCNQVDTFVFQSATTTDISSTNA